MNCGAETESWSRWLSGAWACQLFLNPCPLPRALQFLCTLTGTPQEPFPSPSVSNRVAHSCLSPGHFQTPGDLELDYCSSLTLSLLYLLTFPGQNLSWIYAQGGGGPLAPCPDSHFMTLHSAMVSPTQHCYSHLAPTPVALPSRATHTAHRP